MCMWLYSLQHSGCEKIRTSEVDGSRDVAEAATSSLSTWPL